MYSQVTPFVVATEIWYLLGNLPGFWALYILVLFATATNNKSWQ